MGELPTGNLNLSIGLKLKTLRKEAGFTSYENFAVEFGLARKYYWEVEKGIAKPSVEYLQRVLSYHNVSLSDFFKSISA